MNLFFSEPVMFILHYIKWVVQIILYLCAYTHYICACFYFCAKMTFKGWGISSLPGHIWLALW